jgi:hypothetical protein
MLSLGSVASRPAVSKRPGCTEVLRSAAMVCCSCWYLVLRSRRYPRPSRYLRRRRHLREYLSTRLANGRHPGRGLINPTNRHSHSKLHRNAPTSQGVTAESSMLSLAEVVNDTNRWSLPLSRVCGVINLNSKRYFDADSECFREEVCCAKRRAKLSPTAARRCGNSNAGPSACCIGWQQVDWVYVETISVFGCAIAPQVEVVSSAYKRITGTSHCLRPYRDDMQWSRMRIAKGGTVTQRARSDIRVLIPCLTSTD